MMLKTTVMAVMMAMVMVILPSSSSFVKAVVSTVSTFSSSFMNHGNLMTNPERGAYTSTIYMTSAWDSKFKSASTAQAVLDAVTNYYNTIWMIEVVMDTYINTPTLPQTLINNVQTEINGYKALGQKIIIRFSYNYTGPSDASPAIVYGHISQLTPLLNGNQDALWIVQAGFVGTYGEWAFSTGFPCNDGACGTDGVNLRKQVVTSLMDAVPLRYVQIRYPNWVQRMFSTPTPPTSVDMTTYLGRIGYHDDCYVSDTFDNGESGNFVVSAEIPYEEAWTRYAPFVAETCHVNPPASDCPYALNVSAAIHLTSAHREYDPNVWINWQTQGCYNTMLMYMGYRVQLLSSQSDLQTYAGSTFSLSFQLMNVGWAAPVSARITEIVLRSVDASQNVCVARLPYVDPRYWLTNTTWTVNAVIRLPSTVNAGTYEVLVQFADTFGTMYTQPWNKIGFASNLGSSNAFEQGTGFNKLGQTVYVMSGGTATATQSGEVTAICNFTVPSLVSGTSAGTGATQTCLAGYYMANNVCTWCPAGYSCALSTTTASSSPVACASGTWSAGGQTSCNTCFSSSCSSQGTCLTTSGVCSCNTGYTGFDCSIMLSNVVVNAVIGTTSTSNSNGVVGSATYTGNGTTGGGSTPATTAPSTNTTTAPTSTAAVTTAAATTSAPAMTTSPVTTARGGAVSSNHAGVSIIIFIATTLLSVTSINFVASVLV